MKTSHPILSRLLVLPLLGGYLFLSLFSLGHMGNMAAMGMSMADCPYFPFQETGGKGLNDHLSAWVTFSSITVPETFTFSIPAFLHSFREQSEVIDSVKYTLVPTHEPPHRPPIALLFAEGILHPRIP